MKMETKYYAVVNVVFDLEIDSNSLIVKLNEADIKKIFRILKKLKTNMKAGFAVIEMEMVTFDLHLSNFSYIKIVNSQLYVSRNNILEVLIDENNLVRDIILEKALKKNYDDMKKVMQLLYPPKPKRTPSIKLFDSRYRYLKSLPKKL
jgi:hypothetical protein